MMTGIIRDNCENYPVDDPCQEVSVTCQLGWISNSSETSASAKLVPENTAKGGN